MSDGAPLFNRAKDAPLRRGVFFISVFLLKDFHFFDAIEGFIDGIHADGDGEA